MSRIFLVSLGLLCACAAQVPWVNTRVPPSQWDTDWSACKRMAEYHYGGTRNWDEPTTPGDPFLEYDRQKASGAINDEVSSCMIGRGYVPARRTQ